MGREGAVNNNLHLGLFERAETSNSIELYASTDGADQFLNADGLYALGERFFLIELKSYKSNLKDERSKPSACDLCCRLLDNEHIRDLHDKAHMAAWGISLAGKLKHRVGVYNDMVCNKATLPSCIRLQGIDESEEHVSDDEFLDKVVSEKVGLQADDFIEYLKWLLSNSQAVKADSAHEKFPLSLYATSFSGSRLGLREYYFKSYDAFLEWGRKVVAIMGRQSQNTSKNDSVESENPKIQEFEIETPDEGSKSKPGNKLGKRKRL
jgi:hypothetical protein